MIEAEIKGELIQLDQNKYTFSICITSNYKFLCEFWINKDTYKTPDEAKSNMLLCMQEYKNIFELVNNKCMQLMLPTVN